MKILFGILTVGFVFVAGANLFKELLNIFKLTWISKYFEALEIILSVLVGFVLARLVDKGIMKN